tara:strand:- start:547 stop:1083 length:537 start_codon:yes stop_codon:yes gene_type:complete
MKINNKKLYIIFFYILIILFVIFILTNNYIEFFYQSQQNECNIAYIPEEEDTPDNKEKQEQPSSDIKRDNIKVCDKKNKNENLCDKKVEKSSSPDEEYTITVYSDRLSKNKKDAIKYIELDTDMVMFKNNYPNAYNAWNKNKNQIPVKYTLTNGIIEEDSYIQNINPNKDTFIYIPMQ